MLCYSLFIVFLGMKILMRENNENFQWKFIGIQWSKFYTAYMTTRELPKLAG